ncbi:MAG: hypothetical protein PHU85_02210 [Phycisphaerae bacterium]|nr:hypothetical protein [Phycisphaerae bacterium]
MRAGHDILVRIKRAILAGRYRFTATANDEAEAGDLRRSDALESILNAVAIYKTLRSRNPVDAHTEYLYVIHGSTLDGVFVYTKGKLTQIAGCDFYYVLISAKGAR